MANFSRQRIRCIVCPARPRISMGLNRAVSIRSIPLTIHRRFSFRSFWASFFSSLRFQSPHSTAVVEPSNIENVPVNVTIDRHALTLSHPFVFQWRNFPSCTTRTTPSMNWSKTRAAWKRQTFGRVTLRWMTPINRRRKSNRQESNRQVGLLSCGCERSRLYSPSRSLNNVDHLLTSLFNNSSTRKLIDNLSNESSTNSSGFHSKSTTTTTFNNEYSPRFAEISDYTFSGR